MGWKKVTPCPQKCQSWTGILLHSGSFVFCFSNIGIKYLIVLGPPKLLITTSLIAVCGRCQGSDSPKPCNTQGKKIKNFCPTWQKRTFKNIFLNSTYKIEIGPFWVITRSFPFRHFTLPAPQVGKSVCYPRQHYPAYGIAQNGVARTGYVLEECISCMALLQVVLSYEGSTAAAYSPLLLLREDRHRQF